MPRTGKVAQKSDIRIPSGGPNDARARRLIGALKKGEKGSSRFLSARMT